MKAGDLPSSSTPSNTSAPHPSGGRSLSHLQDLDAQDLPEQHREIVTSEIALFRQRAEKRAAEKKEMEAQMEARRHAPAPSGGNSGQQNRGWGPRGGAAPGVVDPQSYNKPIGFVQPGAEKQAAPAEPVIDDAQRERERAERAHREAQALFEDVSRSWDVLWTSALILVPFRSVNAATRLGNGQGSPATSARRIVSAYCKIRRTVIAS